MISLSHLSSADHDGATLQQRALRRRQRHTHPAAHDARTAFSGVLRSKRAIRALPKRFALHMLVALLVPLAAILSYAKLPIAANLAPAPVVPAPSSDFVVPVAPLALGAQADGDVPAPDASFAQIDALRMPSANGQLFAVQPVPATVAAESANVRGGPGVDYDMTGKLVAGTPLTVLARAGDWYKAQQADGAIIWVAAELLNLNRTAVDLLPEATDIPTPPPAKVAQVTETNLNLRDGPGTNYVGMIKLAAGTQLDLVTRYNDWYQVQNAQGQTGWVLGQHLSMQPGVAERVEAVTTIPNPNPSLVGVASESNVALRGGPGTAYGKLSGLNTGVQIDLLGRYQDWYQVRTSNGIVGWVSNELVKVDSYVARRVPTTRNIPALPQPKAVTSAPPVPQPVAPRSTKPAPVMPAPVQPAPAQPVVPAQPAPPEPQPVPAPPPAPAPAPAPPEPVAANNVVDFALQFRGSRYVWGGASPKGFDCSGFVMYVYGKFGVSLPHSAAGQYNTRYGAIVSNQADLQPGDIVFFANTYQRGISHVGIYIGGGNVMQALSPKQGVNVASLTGGYWQAHYYSAIRPNR